MSRNSPKKEDYEIVFDDFNSRTKNLQQSPCEQLDDMRRTMVELRQLKNQKWRSWCLRDWPCLFTQHRDNIDRMCEQLAPVERRLERECELHMQKDLVQETVRSNDSTKADAEAKSSSASSSVNAQRDYVHRQEVHVTIPNTPKP